MKNLNVIIPMAGHSRRFENQGFLGPKALLPVGDKTMIEHVFNMFSNANCIFHIILNQDQVSKDNTVIKFLKSLAPKVFINIIEPHENGPVYSVLQVSTINNEYPVIISYCDFTVAWNFTNFVKDIEGYDGAIPSFKGFHPSSFGETYYAYMKVDKNSQLLKLKEKESFTETRVNEPASVGIYYFRSFDVYLYYAKLLLKKINPKLTEAYVSLIYNLMVDDKLNILVTKVEKFICLGTPSDYEQYQFWHNYSKKVKVVKKSLHTQSTKQALIPMAGSGKRFRDNGYKLGKPLIPVNGKPMIQRAIESLPMQDKWIFVAKEQDLQRHKIDNLFSKLTLNFKLIDIYQKTSGQISTCLLAENYIDDRSELFISSCDYETYYDIYAWNEIIKDKSIDGAVWTTQLKGMPVKDPEAFAYCKVMPDQNIIQEIVEKKTISPNPNLDPLVIGTFWFRKGKDFKIAGKHAIQNDIMVNGEYYIGKSLNHLIQQGKKIVIFEVDQWISFGDPFELEILNYWVNYFEDILT